MSNMKEKKKTLAWPQNNTRQKIKTRIIPPSTTAKHWMTSPMRIIVFLVMNTMKAKLFFILKESTAILKLKVNQMHFQEEKFHPFRNKKAFHLKLHWIVLTSSTIFIVKQLKVKEIFRNHRMTFNWK